MKVLLLRANPRKNGHTEDLVDMFKEGMIESGATVNDIDLTKMDLRICKGCYACWTTTPGECIQNDEMERLLSLFLESEMLVCATPLYAYSMAGAMKIFLERTMPLLAPGVALTQSGIDRNALRFPEKAPKKMAAIIVGGLKDISNSEGAVASFRLYAEGFGMDFWGALARPESYMLQFTIAKPKAIKTIETSFNSAGRSFITDSKLPEDIANKASLPLAANLEYFTRYSNVYWEIAESLGSKASDLEQVRELACFDVRILMYEMARSVDPLTTSRLKAVFYFHFPDRELHYSIIVDRGTCIIKEEPSIKFDLEVCCDSTIWAKIIRRDLDPVKALTEGSLKLRGDKSLFRAIDRYFPPPE